MRKRYQKVNHPDISLVHNETGEIIGAYHTTKVDSVDEFGMIYINNIEMMYGLSNLQTKILFNCWKYAKFSAGDEGNMIYNTKTFKQKIIESGVTVNPGSIDVAMCQLAKLGILIKLGKCEYLMNPKLFFRGNLAEKCVLESKIIFDPDGRAVGIKQGAKF